MWVDRQAMLALRDTLQGQSSNLSNGTHRFGRRRNKLMAKSQATWRNRIVGSGEEAPDQLLANPKNWRIHPKHQQEALAGVLDEVGWVQEVIVNQQTGHLVDGHLRVTLAL